jgi:hypothetical protein
VQKLNPGEKSKKKYPKFAILLQFFYLFIGRQQSGFGPPIGKKEG